jgi:hypothetical protein
MSLAIYHNPDGATARKVLETWAGAVVGHWGGRRRSWRPGREAEKQKGPDHSGPFCFCNFVSERYRLSFPIEPVVSGGLAWATSSARNS